MKNFIKKLFPDSNSKFISKNQQILSKINEQESLLTKLSDKDLINLSVDMKNQTNVLDDEVIIKSFSIVREASKRILKMRHFDVQILGGLALHNGNIAEMRTGEGKTLVATLPAYLNAINNQQFMW